MSVTYRGPALITAGGAEIVVEVRLSARFEPLEGRWRWAGRSEPHEGLREAFRSGLRTIEIRTKDARAAGPGLRAREGRIGEPDPWGGLRISGTGPPPWRL